MRFLPMIFRRKPIPLFIVFLLSSLGLQAKDKAAQDTLFLKNGEIVIGDIKEMRLGILSIDSKDLSDLDIKISKIRTINSAEDTLRIETADKEIYYGTLKPSERVGWVFISIDSRWIPIEINRINTLISIEKKFWDNISGTISSGFSYTKSSGIGQFNINFSTLYTAKRFDVSITGSGIASIDTSTFSRDREEIDIIGLYNVKGMWYAALEFDYQRNLQLSIARRFQQLLGAAYKAVINRNLQVMGIGGLGISQEKSSSGSDENFLYEIPTGFVVNYYKFSHPNLQISSQHTFYTGLTQWGRVRYDSNTTFDWELIKDFSISINLYLSYDSQPPDGSSKDTDYGTVIGLSYKF